ncbi:MAG: AAA family ATPase [Alphaproteobacteria bacterium]|nr:AAA family ATPase [Alphaproteobacteria bacterium]
MSRRRHPDDYFGLDDDERVVRLGSIVTPRLSLMPFRDIGFTADRQYLVKGLLDQGGMSLLYGAPGCGKSFLALDLALRVALGWPVFGRKVTQGAVIYIAGEGQMGLARRIEAFRRQFLSEDAVEVPFFLLPCAVDLVSRHADADIAHLLDAIRRQVGETSLALAICDTLARSFGNADENASDAMGAFVSNIDRLRLETGAHALAVHHVPKDPARGPRGHSSLLGAVDTAIQVEHDEIAGIRTAKVVKQKDGEIGGPIAFRLETMELGDDQDGDPITSCYVMPADAQAPRRPKLGQRQSLAVRKLNDLAADQGRNIAHASIPPNAPCVDLETWRAALFDAGILDREAANPRTDWQRIKRDLLTAGAVAIHGEWVWPC